MTVNRTDEPESSELFQEFCYIEAEGIQNDPEPSFHKHCIDILKSSINRNGERHKIELPQKSEARLENNNYSALNKVKSLNTRLQHKSFLQNTLENSLDRSWEKPCKVCGNACSSTGQNW